MRFWNLRKDTEIPEDGVLDIDGEIVADNGWFLPSGVICAKELRKALAGVKNVTVRINSPGGDVMAGADIYSALREHSLNGHGRVTVIVTALAASAASVVAMAGDEIRMYPTSYMMIHNPWTCAMGDSHEMRKTAKVLDEISEGLINAYQQRTGKTRDELKRMLDNETWMSAGTCVEEGFADSIIGAEGAAAAKLTMMSAKAHGAGEIAARIRDGEAWARGAQNEAQDAPGDADGQKPVQDADAPEKAEEAEKRADIARRAQIIVQAMDAICGE